MPETTVLQKSIIVSFFMVAVALAALIASLPLPLPSKQTYAQANAANFVDGDIAWMIVSTVFGLFLSPALGYLYGILVGNDPSEVVKVILVSSSVIAFVWVLFTFSLIYGKDAGSNGILGYPITYYMFQKTNYQTAGYNNAATITNSIFAVFELGFALVSAAIVSSSVTGRIDLNGYLFFIFAWHIVVYAPVAHIVWNQKGALYTNYVQDFSGGLPVNVLGALTAIVLHFVIGKDAIPKAGPVQQPEKALYLAAVVWFLWFGFNSGKAHGASALAAQSIVNTIAGTFASILTSFFYNLIFEHPSTSVTLTYAILIGLVALTPASGFVTVGGSMVIGIFSYLFTIIIGQFIISEGWEFNSPLSVVTVHGVAGSCGFFWTAILSYTFINPAGTNGLTYGRGIPLGYQIAALLAVWSVGIVAVAVLAVVCNLIFPIGAGVIPDDLKAVPPESKSVEKSLGGYDVENQGGGFSQEIAVEKDVVLEERYVVSNDR